MGWKNIFENCQVKIEGKEKNLILLTAHDRPRIVTGRTSQSPKEMLCCYPQQTSEHTGTAYHTSHSWSAVELLLSQSLCFLNPAPLFHHDVVKQRDIKTRGLDLLLRPLMHVKCHLSTSCLTQGAIKSLYGFSAHKLMKSMQILLWQWSIG